MQIQCRYICISISADRRKYLLIEKDICRYILANAYTIGRLLAYWKIHCPIGRYIVQSADDQVSADYLQYWIGKISESALFPNLDIVFTLPSTTVSLIQSLSEY